MAFTAGDIIQVTAKLLNAGKEVLNTFHIDFVDPGSAADDDAIRAGIAEWVEAIYDEFDDLISNTYTFDSIDFFNVTQGIGAGFTDWPTLVAGSGVSNPLPPGVCLVVRAGVDAPRREGRKYFGGFTEGDNDTDGTASSALSLALATAYTVWASSFISTTDAVRLIPVILTTIAGIPTPLELGTGLLNGEWDYQRRRKVSVGS